MPEGIPQVAVLVDTSRSYGRDIVRGIRRYVAEQGPWSLYLEPRDLRSSFPTWLQDWPGHGILARTVDTDSLRHLTETGLPVIELRTTVLKHPFPFVGMDNRLVGIRVAEHFLNRGFQRFACCEDGSEQFFLDRSHHFSATLVQRGHRCALFQTSPQDPGYARWDQHQQALADWLLSLERPVGIFATNDQLGFWVLDAARRAGLSVPEEVAVVGAENDKMLCETAWPPLSSVQLRGQAVGHTAARMLAALMQEPTVAQPAQTLLPPGDIIVRQSSDIVAVEDPRLSKALRFIRQHCTDPDLDVLKVAREAGLSRSVLERRLRALIGRSPGEEISRLRFAAVEQLLAQTDLTLDAIAARTGFNHTQYMAEAFRKRTGVTPGKFRAEHRA